MYNTCKSGPNISGPLLQPQGSEKALHLLIRTDTHNTSNNGTQSAIYLVLLASPLQSLPLPLRYPRFLLFPLLVPFPFQCHYQVLS
eukprot:Gb_39805 [translate_table: standard]